MNYGRAVAELEVRVGGESWGRELGVSGGEL